MTSTPLRLRAAGASHPGMRRERNDDYFACAENLGILVVADGVGGRAGGDVAAKIAVDTVIDSIANPAATWPNDALEDPDEVRVRMLAAFASANRRVRERAHQHEDLHGMATTLVAALVLPESSRLVVAHVGDSRGYVQRGKHLERVTEDHRLGSDARTRARIHPDALAKLSPDLLTRAIGTNERVDPDVRVFKLVPGDIIALATDGLMAVLDDAEIAEVIDEYHDSGAAIDTLIDRVNQRGGPDNVTVVLGRWSRA